ncbi:helix-turn-helix domain-containing protein [Candidatus Bathyarchaeota archaeon]|nr:helix-turn-helix domain-containing protein [Candidatus Bathyarchaeota archaeon]
MDWRVVKSIPQQQVQTRMAILREKYGSLSHLHEEFTKGRMPPGTFDDYIDWTNMDHALRAYQEGEDFEYLAEEELILPEKGYMLLTPRRLELLAYLGVEPVSSINDLAEKLERDVKNVYQDLKILERLGFISLRREGRSLVPEQIVYEITILLS